MRLKPPGYFLGHFLFFHIFFFIAYAFFSLELVEALSLLRLWFFLFDEGSSAST